MLLPALQEASASGGVRVVIVMPRFDGVSGGALWQDLKMGVEHWGKWKRIALVTDVDWMRHAVDRTRPTVEADSVTCGDGLNRPLTSRNDVPPVHGRPPASPCLVSQACPRRVPVSSPVSSILNTCDAPSVPMRPGALSRIEVGRAAPRVGCPHATPTQQRR